MGTVFRAYPGRVSGVLLWVIGAAVFSYLLLFPRMLGQADEGLVLYGAKRLLQGQALYKDFFEFITPGVFYFFAAVFGVTGPSLLAARIVMAATNAMSCVLLFRLARKVAATAEACLAVAAFASTCLPVWPYASPHWLSTTLCLGTAAVVLNECWQDASRARAAVAGALAGLTFCVQQHRGVFLGLWLAATILALSYPLASEGRWQRCRRDLIWAACGWLAVTAPILGYAAWRASIRLLLYATFSFVFQSYYPAIRGTKLFGHIAWAGVDPMSHVFQAYMWRPLLRSFPALLALELATVVCVLRYRRGRTEVVRGCVLLLAIIMSVSIWYCPDFIHVAFIAPFVLVVAARLVCGVRSLTVWRQRLLRAVPGVALTVLSVAVARKAWTNLQYAWAGASERFESAVGTLDGTPLTRELLENVRRVVNRSASEPKTLFSYPADPWLYLAVPADNPTPFALLAPFYNTPEQMREAIAALERRPPDCLLVGAAFIEPGDLVMGFARGRYERVGMVGMYEIYGRRQP